MHCPVGAEDDGLGHIGTVFPADLGVDQGACVRALTAARLVGVRERAFTTRDEGGPAPLDDALREVAGLLASGEGAAAVLVDINRPLEGVLAMASLCARSGAAFVPFVPPEDMSFARAGVTGRPSLADLADCDLVLAVGDPFSSHPAVAKAVRDMQFGARGNRLLSLDTAEGRTGRAADLALVVGPRKLAGFLAAVAVECGADRVGEALGGMTVGQIRDELELEPGQVGEVAEALKEANSPGILVSNAPGRCGSPDAVVGALRELAAALECGIWPLLTSTNSALLPWLQAELDADTPGELLRDAGSDPPALLLVVGCDPTNMLPERLWRRLCDDSRVVCWATSLGGPFADAVDVVLPLALPWEEEGTVLAPSGEPVYCPAWLPRAERLADVAELAARIACAAGLEPETTPIPEAGVQAAGQQAAIGDLIGREILELTQPGDGEAVLVSSPEPQGSTGAIPLTDATWQRRLVAEESSYLDAELARGAGLPPGGVVRLSNEVEFVVPYQARDGMPGTVALPAHWSATRELLHWRTENGQIEPAPANVRIEKVD